MVTFLPFRAYSIDNQLIIDTYNVLTNSLDLIFLLLKQILINFAVESLTN